MNDSGGRHRAARPIPIRRRHGEPAVVDPAHLDQGDPRRQGWAGLRARISLTRRVVNALLGGREQPR